MDNKSTINWYPGHMAKTKRLIKENISLIDVVFELIDARVPFSSKISDLDEFIYNKERILIVTKYDLCDKSITDKWIKYYEESGYKVVKVNLKNNQDYKKIINAVDEIRLSINQKRTNKDLKDKELKALVIGVPNVGKSTLINTLAGKKSQKVENRPGVTRDLVWLKTQFDLKILDTPGILWPKLDQEVGLNLAAMTSIKNEILPVLEVANHILNIMYHDYFEILRRRYNLDDDIKYADVFNAIAKKIGALRNDEADEERVSMHILNDIRSEKISGITFDKYNG